MSTHLNELHKITPTSLGHHGSAHNKTNLAAASTGWCLYHYTAVLT